MQHVERVDYDRFNESFEGLIESEAKAVVRHSTDRHTAWRRDFDHLI